MFIEYHVIRFILLCLMANIKQSSAQKAVRALTVVLNSITVQTVYNPVYN